MVKDIYKTTAFPIFRNKLQYIKFVFSKITGAIKRWKWRAVNPRE